MALEIRNIHLPHDDLKLAGKLYTVSCEQGKISHISVNSESSPDGQREKQAESDIEVLDGRGGVLLPSLCHSHIHLDKCYILERGEQLITGDFSEALRITAKVKEGFRDDIQNLYDRGNKLIRDSVEAGVTSMRAHVEIDMTVYDACIRAALELEINWRGICDVRIALFMQDPLFGNSSDQEPGQNASILSDFLSRHEGNLPPALSAVGSAPYVEQTRAQQLSNISFILDLALRYQLHVDFHLDYDLAPLNPSTPEPLIYSVIARLKELNWSDRMPGKVITIGHATRLSVFSPTQLHELRQAIGNLSIHFVGLPQSDVYMMGRSDPQARRGTLNVCKLRKEYDLNMALAVNNVGNAFTPQGTPDPLSLCPLGVPLYQNGTVEGCRILLEGVTTASKRAIGECNSKGMTSLLPVVGSPADFVVLHGNHNIWSAVLDPSYERTTVKAGRVVAWRKASQWHVLHR